MSIRPSAFRESIEDRLVTHSTGTALQELSAYLGLTRPQGFAEESWRQGLYSVAYGPKGQPGGVHAFLEAAMQQWNEDVEVELRPGRTSRIYSVDHEFVQADVGRLIRIEGYGLFLSVGPASVSNAIGEWLDLCPMGGASWDEGVIEVDELTQVTAQILPFSFHNAGPAGDDDGRQYGGDPCRVDVWIHTSLISNAPPHYIQPSADKRANITGSPEGGELMADITRAGHQGRGPWPFYLSGDGLRTLRNAVQALHASGIRVRAYRSKLTPEWLPGRYNRRA